MAILLMKSVNFINNKKSKNSSEVPFLLPKPAKIRQEFRQCAKTITLSYCQIEPNVPGAIFKTEQVSIEGQQKFIFNDFKKSENSNAKNRRSK